MNHRQLFKVLSTRAYKLYELVVELVDVILRKVEGVDLSDCWQNFHLMSLIV